MRILPCVSLSIKKVEKSGWEDVYTLGFPNREVQASFAKYLLAEYINEPVDFTDFTLSHRLRQHLKKTFFKQIFENYFVN